MLTARPPRMDEVPTPPPPGIRSEDPFVRELLSRLSSARLIYHPSALRTVEAVYAKFALGGIHLSPATVCDHLEPGEVLWAEAIDGISGLPVESVGKHGEVGSPETVDPWPELEVDDCETCP